MEFEFDKEIDAILRKARAAEVATSPASAHLDADEFSAFADNAVSEAARGRYVAHLADCTKCRKILSNVVLLNSEAETEAASSVVSATAAAETTTPWYRRLFVFPQLAYTMGAMVLLLSGFFGYLMIKNLSDTKNSDVSFSTQPAAEKRVQEAADSSAANSNTAATNSSAPSMPSVASNSSTTTANSAPLSSGNTADAATPAQPNKPAAEPELNSPVIAPQATPPLQNKTSDNSFVADGQEADKLAKPSPASPTAGATTHTTTTAKEEKQKKDAEDARLGDDDEKSANEQQTMRSEREAKRKQPAPKVSMDGRSNAGEMRSVGGKTFHNIGGIWFDSAVGKQKQKTVRRGTSDYQKLDAGLRSIADQLGGTIVILWGGKAYRIE